VHDEIFAKPSNGDHTAINVGWLTVQAVDMQGWQPLNTGVGEASAIWLAMQMSNETLLIMDDWGASKSAASRYLGLDCASIAPRDHLRA